MHCVLDLIQSESCPDRVLLYLSADIWVLRAADFSETLHRVLLSDLQCDASSDGQVLCHLREFRNHALIYFVELLCGGSVQVKRLYGADFKALHENIVNNFSDALLVKHMRLYDTACAVVEYGRALELRFI